MSDIPNLSNSYCLLVVYRENRAMVVHLQVMKLMAYDISNLTDARYFAARGAHAIGFSALASSVEEINAIKAWVDVPIFFLRLPDNPEPELIFEWNERTGIEIMLINQIDEAIMNMFPKLKWVTFYAKKSGIEISDYAFIFINDKNSIETILDQRQGTETGIFLKYERGTTCFEDFEKVDGLLIKGTREDKLGVKSYEDVDDFLDKFEIEYE